MPSKKVINNFWISKLVKLYYKESGGKDYPLFYATSISNLPELPLNLSYSEQLDHFKNSLINELKVIDFCYGCGINSQTQRCHIKANYNGGEEIVDNLHLLCPNCHLQSENLEGLNYWRWFYNKNTKGAYDLMNEERKPLFDKVVKYLKINHPNIESYKKNEFNKVVREAMENLI